MATLTIDSGSKWYGNVVAVNDVTMSIRPGVTGLLGPNGAGKTTLINMMAGFLPPSTGTVTLDDAPTWRNTEIYRVIGIVPHREAMYDFLTGWRFVVANAELHGLADPGAAARRALALVAMEDAQDRKIDGYSKGMKQRLRVASALVHDPEVLLLDEPFNGVDPRQRIHLIELLRKMGAEGRTVLFSSHILEEVEQLANQIEVLIAGRYAASGDYREIRRLMTDRPHRYVIRSSDARALASALIGDRSTAGVALDGGLDVLRVEAKEFLRFAEVLPRLARDAGIRLYEVAPVDESLESVFSYLVES